MNMLKAGKKAQASVEYMTIIAIVMIILMPIIFYAYQQNETAIRTSQASLAASRISSAADNLYAQGLGAKTSLDIFLPAGYSSQSFASGNIINIKVYTPSGINDVIRVTKANLTGSLPSEPGYKRIYFVMLDSGYVNITG